MGKNKKKGLLRGGAAKGKKRIKAIRREMTSIKSSRAKSEEKKRTEREANVRKRLKRAVVPYQNTHSMLLVGEGNFSFSAALVRHWTKLGAKAPGENLVATSYDSEAQAREKYPGAKTHIEYLRQSGVRVLFGIDATKLEISAALHDAANALSGKTRFQRIVFQFPHSGCGISDTEANNKVHRELLGNFLDSAEQMLDPSSGQIHVTLKRGEPYNSWGFAKLVIKRKQRLLLKTAMDFFPQKYPGYEHRRTLGAAAKYARSRDETGVVPNADILKQGARTYVVVVPAPAADGDDDGSKDGE